MNKGNILITAISSLMIAGSSIANSNQPTSSIVAKTKVTPKYKSSKADNTDTDTLAVITKKATGGDAIAQNTLGLWYYTGKNVKQDYNEAINWWGKSAIQNNADAIGNMAMCFQLGHGAKADSITAMNLYKKALKLGNKDIIKQHTLIEKNTGSLFSCRLLYNCYSHGIGTKKNLPLASHYLERLSKAGDEEMQFNLALQLYNAKQMNEAAKWFKKSAAKGKPGAVFYLGLMTFQGTGIAQDKAQGLKLLQKAADMGFLSAYHRLGQAYLDGNGVEQDLNKAQQLLMKCAGKYNNAAYDLARCYIKKGDMYMAAQWVAEVAHSHQKQVNALLADTNNKMLCDYLAALRLYYIDKDYDAAIKAFKILEKQGLAEGIAMQAVCMGNKNYAKRNVKKAAKMMQKATNKGSMAAAYYLSVMTDAGQGVKQDKAKALELLKKAADGGIAFAQNQLGDIYYKGNGVTQDFMLAAKYYLMAEAQRRLSPASTLWLSNLYELEISALPDLDNKKERMEELKKAKENNNLIELLKALK